MGGDYYGGREVVAGPVAQEQVSQIFQNVAASPDVNPRGRTIKCENEHAVVMAIDVTGSMGIWTKILWDKMPMFYGQLIMQRYLDAIPGVTFAAIGDHTNDSAPLQVTDFAAGLDIDAQLQKLWLEGGGGSTWEESYELAAYYFLKNCDVTACKGKPFLFFTGDESFYPAVSVDTVRNLIDPEYEGKAMTSEEVFAQLRNKFEVYLLHKPNEIARAEAQTTASWAKVLGKDRILTFSNPKAVVDVLLGTIAIATGARTLAAYRDDLVTRGQDAGRIQMVMSALSVLPGAGPPGGALAEGKDEELAAGLAAVALGPVGIDLEGKAYKTLALPPGDQGRVEFTTNVTRDLHIALVKNPSQLGRLPPNDTKQDVFVFVLGAKGNTQVRFRHCLAHGRKRQAQSVTKDHILNPHSTSAFVSWKINAVGAHIVSIGLRKGGHDQVLITANVEGNHFDPRHVGFGLWNGIEGNVTVTSGVLTGVAEAVPLGVKTDWTCPACTLTNKASAVTCDACGAAVPDEGA